MKHFYLTILAVALSACDNTEELGPRTEDVTGWSIEIPTSRLSYEERDLIKNMQAAYEAAVAERAAEEAAQNETTL